MPDHPKNMDIDVIITPDASPKGVKFKLDGPGKTGPDEFQFKNDKHPGVLVYFNIKDPQDTGIRFKPTPSTALWVRAATGTTLPPCPTSPSTWVQFVPLSVEDDGKQLIVYNRNWNAKLFRYTLWFEWPDGTPVDHDPIGDNANGIRR
jgi:hypothetical protein